MKAWLRGFYYSLPIQLLFLHFRRYQVLLVFWFMLFSIVDGVFMKSFGADSLYLAPEYLGNVTAISFAVVGIRRAVARLAILRLFFAGLRRLDSKAS